MEFIAIIGLLAAGYFLILKTVLTKAQNPSTYQAIAILVLVLYLCAAGFVWVLYDCIGNGGWLFYICVLFYVVCFFPWYIFQCIRLRKQIQTGAFVTALVYLCLVFYLTVFSRNDSGTIGIQMELFGWVKRCIELESYDPARHFLQNLALFVPIGFLLFLAHQRKLGSPAAVFSFALSVSAFIETIQLFGGFGTCDVDDILSNAIGAIAGVLLGKLLIFSHILPADETGLKEVEIS
jgi:glycopeptide antibiotics resistance protein